jgi:hypothetical protein
MFRHPCPKSSPNTIYRQAYEKKYVLGVKIYKRLKGGIMAGYPGLKDEPVNERANAHSALSGSEYAPSLESDHPEEDAKVRDKILKMLKDHTELDTSKLEVAVKEGFVSLIGVTSSSHSKATIEALVEQTEGVADVASLIEIDETSDVPRSTSGDDNISIKGSS